MALTKDQILAADDRPTVAVDVPEWGGPVLLRPLSAAERDAWERDLFGEKDEGAGNGRARLVAACAVAEGGAPLFTAADVAALGAKSSVPLERLFRACLRLNRMRKQDLEELAKN